MVSIVIPVYNEEESIDAFYNELSATAKSLKTYEILFVDDGSKDSSLSLLKAIGEKDKRVKIFSFRKNHGKAEALMLGFLKATGKHIITLDADLQDKPSEIPALLRKINDGYDLVSGWRKNRKDGLPKVLASKLFNSIAKTWWGLKLHDYNCGLKAYTKNAAKSLRIYGGLHRFIPLILYHQGFMVTEIPVEHDKRKFGKSKYGFSKLWKDLPDIFTMLFLSRYGDRPFHFFAWVGGVLFFLGTIILGYLGILKLVGEGIGNRPILFLGMILLLSGLQIFFTGFLADLIINLSKQQREDYSLKFSSENI